MFLILVITNIVFYNTSAGTYADTVGTTSCVSCPAGTYSTTKLSDSVSNCLPCPIGFFSFGGAIACTKCQNGSITESIGASICSLCPSGTYANVSSCVQCPSGTYQPKSGASSINDCISCPPGQYHNSLVKHLVTYVLQAVILQLLKVYHVLLVMLELMSKSMEQPILRNAHLAQLELFLIQQVQ